MHVCVCFFIMLGSGVHSLLSKVRRKCVFKFSKGNRFSPRQNKSEVFLTAKEDAVSE